MHKLTKDKFCDGSAMAPGGTEAVCCVHQRAISQPVLRIEKIGLRTEMRLDFPASDTVLPAPGLQKNSLKSIRGKEKAATTKQRLP